MRRISVFLLGISGLASAQECPPVSSRIAPRGNTIFSEAQEVFLGDAVSAQIQRTLPIYRVAGLTTPLERIGSRILKYLPPNEFQFRFTLLEIPVANAFVLPGGRIFVSRKLVSFVKSEDELAGVLGHEMGHVLARQASIAITKELAALLKVTSVGDPTTMTTNWRPTAFLSKRWPARGTTQRASPVFSIA